MYVNLWKSFADYVIMMMMMMIMCMAGPRLHILMALFGNMSAILNYIVQIMCSGGKLVNNYSTKWR